MAVVKGIKGRKIKLDNIEDLIALDDYTIIEAHNAEDVSTGGIIIPDKAQQSSFRGTVISVGPGKRDANGEYMPLGIEPGDVVIYRNFTGWKVAEIDGKTYYTINSEERFAKIPQSKVVYEN